MRTHRLAFDRGYADGVEEVLTAVIKQTYIAEYETALLEAKNRAMRDKSNIPQ